jgi:hypothetical protein
MVINFLSCWHHAGEGGYMASCDFLDRCFFFNTLLIDMPRTTKYLREKYCMNIFNACARYRIAKVYGKDKVPIYLFPNDMFELLDTDLPEISNSPGDIAMMIKVLYADGVFGTVRSANLGELVKKEGIVAYKCSEGWVEVRRKRNIGYSGKERRVHIPGM